MVKAEMILLFPPKTSAVMHVDLFWNLGNCSLLNRLEVAHFPFKRKQIPRGELVVPRQLR